MSAKNDITGDNIKTKYVSDKYRDNFDEIFRKKVSDEVLNKNNQEEDKPHEQNNS